MIVNVSSVAGWIRVWLSVTCLGALGWAIYVIAANHGTAYNNLELTAGVLWSGMLILDARVFLD